MWRDAAQVVVDLEAERGANRARESLLGLARLARAAANELPSQVAEIGLLCASALRNGQKILVCGNGGSAADASHFVAELVGRMGMERWPLPAISLCVDPSVVTCIANDYGYEQVFARQVQGLGRPDDVLIGLTTSGRSANVIAAVDAARRMNMRTVVLTGGGATDPRLEASDALLRVPSGDTARIQEIHGALLHAVCDVAEQSLFG